MAEKNFFNTFLAYVFAIRCGNKCFYLCVLAQEIKLRQFFKKPIAGNPKWPPNITKFMFLAYAKCIPISF